MRDIEKVVEVFPRRDPFQPTSLVSLRVYYTDGSYETIQVKFGTEKYYEYMKLAHPDINFDEQLEDEEIAPAEQQQPEQQSAIKPQENNTYFSTALMVVVALGYILYIIIKAFLE